MKLNENFTFGQYNNLTLLEVYQGTQNINKTLLNKYLLQCFECEGLSPGIPEFKFIEQIVIREGEIVIFPDNTFDENKEPGLDNLIILGNISRKLSEYFNSFFNLKLRGKYESFEKFNQKNGQYVIGGDPAYIKWCLKENLISLDSETILELEEKEVYRFNGIKILEIKCNKYSYHPIILKEYYKFKAC